jgi:fucose permease
MTGMIIGYLLGIILIPKYISQEKMLKIFSIIGIIITIAILLLPTHLSVYTVPLLGFAHSIMWPCIWPIALRNADEKAEMVSALLIMGIIGGAILGPFFGWLCDKIDMQYAYSILIVSYLYLIFYSRVGERVRQSETN